MTTTTRQPSTRAEQVRQRRGQETQQRPRQAAAEPKRAANRPPVVSRSSMAGTPGTRAKAKVARRQYYYTLATPGAEVRLPALPAIHFGWRLLSGLIVTLMVLSIYTLTSTTFFQVSAPKITGAARLTAEDINTVLNLSGENIVAIDPQALHQDLLTSFPEIASATVKVKLPAGVGIQIVERTPVITWTQDGKTQWIDQDGIAFPIRGEAPAELIAVQAEGAPPAIAAPVADPATTDSQTSAAKPAEKTTPALPEASPFLTVEMVKAIQSLTTQAPAGVPLVYNPRYGFGWNDPRGWQVYFGLDVSDVQVKLEEYNSIVKQLTEQGIQPKLISVEFLHAPFYRLE